MDLAQMNKVNRTSKKIQKSDLCFRSDFFIAATMQKGQGWQQGTPQRQRSEEYREQPDDATKKYP
ncbi:MAG TPA: hypothetical protein DCF33_10340 [Saprospirales bacterium]|nr:hypothetical protein [Saprospirales bacterium]